MDDNTQTYTFHYTQEGDGQYDPLFQTADKSITLPQDEPWPRVMYEFCKFLSGIYGYDIADQLVIYKKHNDSYNPLTSVVFDNGGYVWPLSGEDEDE